MYTFMDYIKGGTQLHCSIGIDFTGINCMFNRMECGWQYKYVLVFL